MTLCYYYKPLFQIFTQSLDAIDVTSVTLWEAIVQKIPEFYEIISQTGRGGHRFMKVFHVIPVFFE